ALDKARMASARRGIRRARVTPEQWKLFAQRLQTARSYIDVVDPDSDPHAYCVLMDISRGSSEPRARLDALYTKAIRANPTYFHYYSERAIDMLERWFGSDEDLASYVESVLTHPGGEDGQVAYTFIAYRLRPY